jgi:hypothetical protein
MSLLRNQLDKYHQLWSNTSNSKILWWYDSHVSLLQEAAYPSVRCGIHNFWNWCCHLYNSCNSAMQRYMIVLAYLGIQCTKFHAAGWNGLMHFRDGADSQCASDFLQILEKVRRRPWQWLDKRSGRKHEPYTERPETGEEQRQEHAHHLSLTSRGLLTKKSFWQANWEVLDLLYWEVEWVNCNYFPLGSIGFQ